MWIDAVVFGLGHGAHAFVIDGGAHRQIAHRIFQTRANHFAVISQHVLNIVGPEIIFATFVGAARVNVIQHHALREQLGEGLVHFDQAQIAHHLGPEARIEQVQNGVFNAANVLVHRHPVVGALGHHLLGVLGVAIAHEVPRRIDKRVHGVGFAARGFAAHRTHHTGVEAFVFVQRITRTIGDAILRQHHGQIFFGHRHSAVFIAMDDGNRRAPITLTANAPVAQTPSGFLLAQTFGSQVSGHGFQSVFEIQAVVFARVDQHAVDLVAKAIVPLGVAEGHAFGGHHLLNGQLVLQRKRKVTLVVRWHAHHGAIAVAHEHIVAHPHFHRFACERMRHRQARAHAFFFFDRHLGFGGAALLAGLNEGRQSRLREGSMRSQWMLRRHGTKGHAHDGVGSRGEHIHLAVLNQLTVGTANVVRKRKAHTGGFANPVFLHELDALGPTGQLVAGDKVEQLFGVIGNLQVVARNLALLNHRACAPAFAVDHLLVGQHGLINRIPIDNLRLAIGHALL